jgi:hypothetical protein
MDDDEPEEKTRCQVCLTGCKHVTTFILSHVGLVTLVVGYCLVGAVTFEALEVDHEIEVLIQNIIISTISKMIAGPM